MLQSGGLNPLQSKIAQTMVMEGTWQIFLGNMAWIDEVHLLLSNVLNGINDSKLNAPVGKVVVGTSESNWLGLSDG